MSRMQRLGRALELALCRLSHMDEPVAINRRDWYVLFRCARCGRETYLMGDAAREWVERWMADPS